MLLKDEAGLGLVEMLLALVILNIAILAMVATFSSGTFALQRASRVATAATLADSEMERLRALRFCDIRLDPETGCTDTPQAATPASADKVGADGRTYRVQASIVSEPPAVGVTRNIKRVTLTVRDVKDSLKILTSQSSTFDQATGS